MLLDGGHFDLVVADLLLPRAEGVAIALRIRASGAAYSGVPILGITGKGDVAGTTSMREAGITEFIQKPFWKGSLRPALDRALAQAL